MQTFSRNWKNSFLYAQLENKSRSTLKDIVLELMRANKVPLTVENYVAIVYMGDEIELDGEFIPIPEVN